MYVNLLILVDVITLSDEEDIVGETNNGLIGQHLIKNKNVLHVFSANRQMPNIHVDQ